MSGIEITKDFHVARPTEPSKWASSGFSPRAWKLGEIEGAMWQARAAGANDETEVDLDHKGITVKALPAFPIEIPPAMRRQATRLEMEPPPPRPPLTTRALVRLGALGLSVMVGVPLAFLLVVTVFRLVIGVIW